MKAYFILTMTIVFLLTACSQDEIDTSIDLNDFSGTYIGNFDCTGSLAEDNGASFLVIITKKAGSEIDYTVSLEDDLQFDATVVDNKLRIPNQIFNSQEEFDRVTMEGDITKLEDGNLNFEFIHSVDEESSSECTTALIKE